jgi:uncharacterized HAD superfamily protein
MKKIIGFDIDGVLTTPDHHPWEDELLAYFQLEQQPDSEMGNMMGRYGLTREQMQDFFSTRSHFVFPKLTMREGANLFLQELKSLGFTIILITARTNSPETPRWLEQHQISYDLLVHEHDKLDPCVNHGLQLFVEDNYENAKAISPAIPVLLMDTVYNRLEDLPNVHRVHDYAEIRDFVFTFFEKQIA